MDADSISIRHADESQQGADIQAVAREVLTILTRGEEIEYICRQNFNAGPKRDSVIATTNRLIFYEPQLFGRFNFRDYLWRDVEDANLSQGMLSSELTVTLIGGVVERIRNLDKEQARRIYTICQGYEEEWREKRRLRDLEAARARSGGFVYPPSAPEPPAPPPAPAPPSPPAADDPVKKLAQLKAMLDQGLIEQAEYDAVKQRILDTM